MNEELKVIITAEINKLKKGTDDAKKQVKSFKDRVKEASKDVDKNFKAIGQSITDSLKAGAKAIGVFLGSLGGLTVLTAEYRDNHAKLITAFEEAGAGAYNAKRTYNELYRVLGDDGQTVEAANHLAQLTTNQRHLSEWTNICQGVYATFGDSLPIEGLTEAANETAKTGALTGGLTDALNWAGVAEEEFQKKLDACNTEAEREALIRETLNGLYSDAAAKYEENNASVLAQNEAQAKLTSQLAAVSEAIQPVVTAFTNFASQALAAVSPYLSDLTANLLPVLQSLLDGIISALETALSWVSQHTELLAGIAIAIGTVVAAIGLYNAVAAVKAAMDAAQVTSLGALIAAKLASAAATIAAIAPYIAIIAIIALVVAAIVYCVKHWDELKEIVGKVAEWIKEKVSAMAESVGQWFNDMKEKISNAISAAKEIVSSKFEEIKTNITEKITQAKENVSNLIEQIKAKFTEKFEQIKTNVSNIVSSITNFFSDKFTAAKETLSNIFGGIKDSIVEKLESAKQTVKGIVDSIVGFFGGAKFTWPKISMPKFGITPDGWKVGDLLKGVIPKLSIKWNALGGVFEKPTLTTYGGTLQGLGEAGAEAIVPLEKNTKWLEIIANKLSEKQANRPVILTVDGKVFAQTSIDAINALTRQTGTLGINLA